MTHIVLAWISTRDMNGLYEAENFFGAFSTQTRADEAIERWTAESNTQPVVRTQTILIDWRWNTMPSRKVGR